MCTDLPVGLRIGERWRNPERWIWHLVLEAKSTRRKFSQQSSSAFLSTSYSLSTFFLRYIGGCITSRVQICFGHSDVVIFVLDVLFA